MDDDPINCDDLPAADRDALKRAMQIAQRDPLRAEQLQKKLEDEEWTEVAMFAAYGCQIESLSLRPWQSPPAHIDENADEPENPEREPDTAARKLLRRMLRAGVSRFDPDPLTALQRAAKRRQVKPAIGARKR
jgi:hypothetical protein